MSLRVLHFIPTLGGGGAERQLAYLATALRHASVDAHIAMTLAGPNLARLEKEGVGLHLMPARAANDVRAVVDLRRVIRAVRPEVIQTWLSRMDVWGGVAATTSRIPWILSERSSWHNHDLAARARARVARHAAAVVANSEAGALHWRRAANGAQEVCVIPNGIPLEEVDAAAPVARAALGIDTDAEVVLFVGRLVYEKNVGLLMQVLVELMRERPRLHAVISGLGPLASVAHEVAAGSAYAARFHFVGFSDQVWGLLKSSDVFLSTSQVEGRPNAVIEAMACRCPMVLSDIPQHREFVPNDAALFFSTLSATSAIEAINRALSDRGAARQRADRARDAATAFSIAHMAQRYADVYRHVAHRAIHASPGLAQ